MTFSCYRLIIWKMTLHFFHKYLININNDDCCDLNHGKIISPRIFKCKTKAMPKSECIIFKKNAFFSSPGFFSFLFLHQYSTSHIPTYHILHSCEKNPTWAKCYSNSTYTSTLKVRMKKKCNHRAWTSTLRLNRCTYTSITL